MGKSKWKGEVAVVSCREGAGGLVLQAGQGRAWSASLWGMSRG